MSEEDRIYQVEKIIGRKEDRQGNIFYRVHWVGYGPRYDSWEPLGNLGSCEDLIEEFYELQSTQKSPADRYNLRSRRVARAKPEPSADVFSSDDEATPKPKAKKTLVRRQRKEKSKSPVRRTKQIPRADKEDKKQQEEEKEQPPPQLQKPLPAKSQEAQKEETKLPQPRQSVETFTTVTAGLSARTYDLRSAHRRQATSRLAGLEISSDEDETSIAGSTPTQRSTVRARMTLSESKFQSRLSKIQSGQTTVPLDSSPSVTRRLQFTSTTDTTSKEPEEEKEEESSEAIVPSGFSTSEELKEEGVPAWMQIARAEVGFAVLVTLFVLVGYFCYYTDHCSRFYP